jgi:hypothetical protein
VSTIWRAFSALLPVLNHGDCRRIKSEKAIIESAQPYNLVDDVFFMRNNFMIFIAEKM